MRRLSVYFGAKFISGLWFANESAASACRRISGFRSPISIRTLRIYPRRPGWFMRTNQKATRDDFWSDFWREAGVMIHRGDVAF
jgi:hypothetical protein